MSRNGGVIGGANIPSTQVASGAWGARLYAQQVGGIASGLFWPSGVQDANFASVTFLAHFDTAIPANLGSAAPEYTYIGGCTASATHTKFSAASAFVNASAQGVQVTSDTGFAFASGDFTVEFWVWPVSLGTSNVFDMRTTGNSVCPNIYYMADGSIHYFVSNADKIAGAAASIVTGAWQHVALARTSTSTKLFVGGVQVGSTYSDSNNYTQGGFTIGNSNLQASIGVAGTTAYFAEPRVTKGFCRYTTGFTAPTARFPDL